MNIKTNLANRNNYGKQRKLSNIKYIVIHYTGNDGDSDESNTNFFKRKVTKTSAHYFVDDDSITRSVPDDYIAYSVGGKKYTDYKKTGGAKLHGKCTNANSISIELCDSVKNGVIKATHKTINNAIELTKELMKVYNIPVENVIRHFDVNGKHCPAYWCCNMANDILWETEFKSKLKSVTKSSFVKDGIDYSYVFEPKYYANRYKDLAINGVKTTEQLFNHFLTYGMKEKRQAIATFNVTAYAAYYEDLRNAFKYNWEEYYKHFCKIGHIDHKKSV